MTRKKIKDAEFVRRLLSVGESRAELARQLGISAGAVSQRATKLASLIQDAKKASEGGGVAALVSRVVPKGKNQQEAVKAASFVEGLEAAGRQYHIFDHLEDLYMDIKALLDCVKKDIDETKSKNRPIKPFHIDQVVKLVNQSRNLIVDAHKIKLDLSQAKNLESFIAAMLSVVIKYDPQVKEKLYVELAGVGMEGQIALFVEGCRPSSSSDGGNE